MPVFGIRSSVLEHQEDGDAIFWALAVLWKDPAAATPQFVGDFLDNRGLKEGVESYLAKL